MKVNGDTPKRVKYSKDLRFRGIQNKGLDQRVEIILTKKLDMWKHEKEYRVLTKKQYVNVEIIELILGYCVDESTEKFLTNEQKKFCPNAKIRKIDNKEIDKLIGLTD